MTMCAAVSRTRCRAQMSDGLNTALKAARRTRSTSSVVDAPKQLLEFPESNRSACKVPDLYGRAAVGRLNYQFPVHQIGGCAQFVRTEFSIGAADETDMESGYALCMPCACIEEGHSPCPDDALRWHGGRREGRCTHRRHSSGAQARCNFRQRRRTGCDRRDRRGAASCEQESTKERK